MSSRYFGPNNRQLGLPDRVRQGYHADLKFKDLRADIEASFADMEAELAPSLEDVTLYVDGATGADNNPGTSALPFATIQAAIDSLPYRIRHLCTINIAAGTYIEAVVIDKDFDAFLPREGGATYEPPIPTAGGRLHLKGTEWETPYYVTGGSATRAGTTTGAAAIYDTGMSLTLKHTVSGETWTIGDLSGHFCRPTEGFLSGNRLPIGENGADFFILPRDIGDDIDFVIEQPAARILPADLSGSDSTLPAIRLKANGSHLYCVTIEGLELGTDAVRSSAPNNTGLLITQGSAYLLETTITDAENLGIYSEDPNTFLWCSYTSVCGRAQRAEAGIVMGGSLNMCWSSIGGYESVFYSSIVMGDPAYSTGTEDSGRLTTAHMDLWECIFAGGGSTIVLYGATVYAYKCLVYHDSVGVDMSACPGVTFKLCDFWDGNYWTNILHAVGWAGADNNAIEFVHTPTYLLLADCNFYGAGFYGIYVESGFVTIRVDTCHFEACADAAIKVATNTSDVHIQLQKSSTFNACLREFVFQDWDQDFDITQAQLIALGDDGQSGNYETAIRGFVDTRGRGSIPMPAPAAVDLTFNLSASTITRASGNWGNEALPDIGDRVTITGSVSNNGDFYILGVSGLVITVGSATALVDEGPVAATATLRRVSNRPNYQSLAYQNNDWV